MKIKNPHDVDYFIQELLKISTKKEFNVHQLGSVGNDPIYLIENGKREYCSNILIAAGFHGDEPAGPWSILSFLSNLNTKTIENINLSFLPPVNPTGFRVCRRYNNCNENPNRGFIKGHPSKEGKILLDNIEMIVERSQDGFLSLHEDIDKEHFFLYAHENNDEPGIFSFRIRDVATKYFPLHPDGNDPDYGVIKEGIIFNHSDGSFEDLMFRKGVLQVACIETPGKRDLHERVLANVMIINSFIGGSN